MSNNRFATVIELIDTANSKDPRMTPDDPCGCPAALVYGQRMAAMLEEFDPSADDLLRIAVRAQHIERWTRPRADYPSGRAGYLKWRADLKRFHAAQTSDLMQQAGYATDDIERVAALIRKEGLKRDPQAQTLEDVACLVFLKHYAADFIADHDDTKVIGILAKTARKMSPEGVSRAAALPLSERLGRLLTSAVA